MAEASYKTLNNTLEEELRRELIEKNKELQLLKNRCEMLEQSVRDEQTAKYEAYKRISKLIAKTD